MLKRLSTLRKKKETENGIAPSTTTDQTNGSTSATSNGVPSTSSPQGVTTNGRTPARPVNGDTNGNHRSSFFGKTKSHNEGHQAEPAATHGGMADSFKQFAQLIRASERPMPSQTGDGSYLDHTEPTGLLDDLKTMGFKDIKTLKTLLTQKEGELSDDHTMIMEKVIQLVANLPDHSAKRVELTDAFIGQLWFSLEHPPKSYMGDKYKYRSADGSNNNPYMPMLGAAHTPYARSVRPDTLNLGALPDPGLIFDSVFARETFKEHPNKVSSMFYYWASLIIHDLFQTSHEEFNISQTSSYLDLSTLYGDDQNDQDQIRTFKDGKLKPDCYSEKRLLGFPPGCGMILIMLNRYHNFIVEQLASVNENGRFTKPSEHLGEEAAQKAWAKYDNDLFQTGRLITCGLYINITLYDYLRTIVNLNRTNSTWTLDPRTEMGRKVMGQEAAPRGGGNAVSCEFSVCYRWHSNISAKDELWTEQLYKKLFGKSSEEVSMKELLMGLGQWERSVPEDPYLRDYAGLKRGPDGKFDDGEIANILNDAIEDVAGASGANNVPKALRAVTILGIQQGRHWMMGSLNELRRLFGLTPHKTFESINPDPKVAAQLRHLYEHPDYVEIYAGLTAEAAKEPMVPGVGIAPTYTVSRALLSDAVTLVRGDRFYTTDYSPVNLTHWGYSEAQYDLQIQQGCVMNRLFLRTLPNHYTPNSIYCNYPMTIPSENYKIMQTLGRLNDYDYERPTYTKPRINLSSFAAAKYMLERPEHFKVTWGTATGALMGKGGFDFMLSGDSPSHAKQKETMAAALYKDNWEVAVRDFYEYITLRLLHEKTANIAGTKQIDITRDLGNLAHCHFAANVFSLPMKTAENPHGVLSEHEMYGCVALIFIAIFFDIEPSKSFALRKAGTQFAQQLGKLIEINVKSVAATGFVSGMVDKMRENHTALREYGVHMVRKLLESGLSVYEATWSQILPVAAAMIPNQAEVFTQALDFYLSPEGLEHLPAMQKLALENTAEADAKLMIYVMEGIRLNGTFGSYRESTVSTTIQDSDRSVHVEPGDKVFCSFVSANRDPEAFPNPNAVDPNRPLDGYLHYGTGAHQCLGMRASRIALTSMFKVILRECKNLRRAPGDQGQLKKVPREGGFYAYLTDNFGSLSPFPMTWKLHYDGELSPLPAQKH